MSLGATSAVTLAVVIATAAEGVRPVVVVVLAVLLLSLLLFGWLTVEVSTGRVALWFGPGVIRKRVSIADIRAVRVVRNRWYYGWGIRFTPHGWLYNVSGLDAVEIELQTGRRFRIGTDEPRALADAIDAVLAERDAPGSRPTRRRSSSPSTTS